MEFGLVGQPGRKAHLLIAATGYIKDGQSYGQATFYFSVFSTKINLPPNQIHSEQSKICLSWSAFWLFWPWPIPQWFHHWTWIPFPRNTEVNLTRRGWEMWAKCKVCPFTDLVPPEVTTFYNELTEEDKQILKEIAGRHEEFQNEDQALEALKAKSEKLYNKVGDWWNWLKNDPVFQAVELRNLVKGKIDALNPEAKEFVTGVRFLIWVLIKIICFLGYWQAEGPSPQARREAQLGGIAQSGQWDHREVSLNFILK